LTPRQRSGLQKEKEDDDAVVPGWKRFTQGGGGSFRTKDLADFEFVNFKYSV
jgi:hypothetical protein